MTAAVEVAVVRSGVVAEPGAVAELVEDCEARALERCTSVLDAERYTPTAMSRYLTSEAVIAADAALNLGFAGLAGGGAERDQAGGALAQRRGLGAGQIEAVEAMSGTRRLEVVIGPAGSGKTKMLAVASERLAEQGRDLVVVAPPARGPWWPPPRSAPRDPPSRPSSTGTAFAGTRRAGGPGSSRVVTRTRPPAASSRVHANGLDRQSDRYRRRSLRPRSLWSTRRR